MRKAFLILLLFLSIAARAQNPIIFFADIDSLKKAETIAREDTNKVILYENLSFAYLYINQDTAVLYATKGLELAKRLHFIKGEALLLVEMGEALAFQGNFAKGLKLKLEGLQKAEPLKDSSLLTLCYNFIGANYLGTQDYETALVYFNKIKAFSNFKINQSKYLLGQIGSCYIGLNQLDSAYYYTKLAYDLDLKGTRHWEILYKNMGTIEEKRGNYSKALQYYRMDYNLANCPIIGMASTFRKMGQRDSAIYYAKAILESKTTYFLDKLQANALLTELYKSSNDLDSAFKYQELMLAVKDSIYSQEKIKQLKNLESNEQQRQLQLEQQRREAQQQYEARVKLYSLIGGLVVLIFIAFMLYRNNRRKQRTNALLEQKNQQIESTLQELKATQAQLIQSEKMASLGELTAGIAHEIQNPLNFVTNFSEVNGELLDEMNQELQAGHPTEALQHLGDIRDNNSKIAHHGKRADAIVKGMLQHSRASSGQREPTDINALADEFLRLSYHGLRAKDKSFNATIKTDFDKSLQKIEVVPQEVGRVLLNLFNNAFYAVTKQKEKSGSDYEPTVSVSTKNLKDNIEIVVADNGMGISKSLQDKIFQPFFTTKPAGDGTGLGLSLSYDIIKAHGGTLQVTSEEGHATEFVIQIPR